MPRSAEQWRPVPDTEDRYQVSDRGRVARVRKFGRRTHRRILKWHSVPGGYPSVTLSWNSRIWGVTVARLVAAAFLPPPPTPGAVIRYADGDPRNCRAANLVWSTRRKCCAATATGPKLDWDLAREIRECQGHASRIETARRYKISEKTVSDIWHGRTWAEPK